MRNVVAAMLSHVRVLTGRAQKVIVTNQSQIKQRVCVS
jgi:hypothetical protein